ncbi:hypothetical protein CC2G_002187 [Coprinopsis cinerea AmutBmut pab1-1]|nr:hypothetical protein CC2G_002187 [Coprinopsis cinerea AmutBmut pab1-1]
MYRGHYDVPPRLQHTLGYSFYALTLYHEVLTGKHANGPQEDIGVPDAVREELNAIIHKVAEARKRTVRFQWSWKEFQDGYDECRYDIDLLLQRFPAPAHDSDSRIDYPVSFEDRDGRLLYIYVPSLLRKTRIKNIFDASCKIFRSDSSLVGNILRRSVEEHSKILPPNPTIQTGCFQLFPAKGHQRILPWVQPIPASTTFSDPQLRPIAYDFLDAIDPETAGVLGAVLALTSPNHLHVVYELFEALHTGRTDAQDEHLLSDIMLHWPFPFTDVYLSANAQQEDSHRSHYRPHTLNLYLSAGLSTAGYLQVDGLQRQFAFEAGSIAVGYPGIFLSELYPGGKDDQVMFVGSYDDVLRRAYTPVLHPLPFNDNEYRDYITHMLG